MLTKLTIEEALAQIDAHVAPLEPKRLPADQARGCILAEDITAPMDQPPFDRSPLDGYALIAADLAGATQEAPVRLQVTDFICAGGCPKGPIAPGQAARIMTGAMLPPGADCVVRQEDTDLGEETVAVYTPLRSGDNFVHAGEDFRTGDRLLSAGDRLNAASLAVLASAGLAPASTQVLVRPRPRVAVLCTGDELVYPQVSPLPAGKIYDSNYTLLTERLGELGLSAGDGGAHFGDDPELVARSIRQALTWADAVITTGGVSVGVKDIFHQVLPLLGAEQIFTRCKIKPGTPTIFSTVQGKPILSLSGNPFAAAALFEVFGRHLLARLAGDPTLDVRSADAVLGCSFGKASKGRRLVRGRFANGAVTLPAGHSSGQLRSMVGCNCLVDIPAGSPPLTEGTPVRVILL
jgi:molybdopterin molybdotransferase